MNSQQGLGWAPQVGTHRAGLRRQAKTVGSGPLDPFGNQFLRAARGVSGSATSKGLAYSYYWNMASSLSRQAPQPWACMSRTASAPKRSCLITTSVPWG